MDDRASQGVSKPIRCSIFYLRFFSHPPTHPNSHTFSNNDHATGSGSSPPSKAGLLSSLGSGFLESFFSSLAADAKVALDSQDRSRFLNKKVAPVIFFKRCQLKLESAIFQDSVRE